MRTGSVVRQIRGFGEPIQLLDTLEDRSREALVDEYWVDQRDVLARERCDLRLAHRSFYAF